VPPASADLTPLFAPRRVAVLGASRNPAKLGHRLVQNLLTPGFPGDVIAVNPSGEAILGRAVVPRVEDLPRDVDLALVSLPAAAALPAVRALGARGCRICVILASGFAETGAEGRAAQEELARIAGATGMRIVGPNCMGVVNVPGRLNASYFWDVPREPGGISFVSQSGAYGGLFFRDVRERALGVAKFLSIGNQSDLGFTECLAWLADDPETYVVGLFVEGIRDGRAFVAAARRLARAKPVVALKGGRADAGRRAAGSHTGSLAGTWETYRAAFLAAGIVPVDETEELFDAIATLGTHRARPPRDSTVAILTISGGPSVVAADAADAVGLRIPAFPEARRAALRRHLPDFGADGNPVDMTPQMEPAGFGPSVRLVLEAPEVAGAVAIDIGLDRPEYGDALTAAQAATGKPVVACTVDTPEMDARLRAGGVPLVPGPERAIRAYRALVRHAELHRQPEGDGPRAPSYAAPAALAARVAAARGRLDHADARALLESYGVRFPRERLVTTTDEAGAAARDIGFPLVVKTLRPEVLHRTERGGVILGVEDERGLIEAMATITARLGPGPMLIQEQVAPGLELLVGGRRDASFGPTVLVGLGGVLAELVRDVSIGLAPLTRQTARAMLAEGRKGTLLDGYRGAAAVDREALIDVLIAVGDLLVNHGTIMELDLNPLIASGDRLVAVDALVLVNSEIPEAGRAGDGA
jgi:acyl-CoA synthetase (NDP forming)